MITVLLVSCAALGILLYRPLHSLLRQIPKKNGDFNAFMSPADVEHARSIPRTSSTHGLLME